MKYNVLTLFPDLFEPFKKSTLLSKAIDSSLINIETYNLRDFAINSRGQTDDTPYGGGGGMLTRIEPLVSGIEKIKEKSSRAKVIYFTPRGMPLNQKLLRTINKEILEEANSEVILVCSRYEGVDERFVEGWVDYELSVGDFIYMGGEIPALSFIEASSRLIPGVLGNEESTEEESFEMIGLEHPQYTKPRVFRGRQVPELLLGGNHQEVKNYRLNNSIVDTSLRRPDLLAPMLSSGLKLPITKKPPIYLGLIHHPVIDKEGEVITSSITNLDVHDIARSVKTFELNGYYIVHPSLTLRRLIQRICDHWEEGVGSHYNPNRFEALEKIFHVSCFDDVLSSIEKDHGSLPYVVATSARPTEHTLDYESFRQLIPILDRPILFLFGTAWGMHSSLVDRADYRLDPIFGPGDYNHLSVRSAVAIILDRLFGE